MPASLVFGGWGALVAAAALAGMLRGAYIGGVTPTGLVAALGYAGAGLVVGAGWGALLGWVVGSLAALGRLVSRHDGAAARSWPAAFGRGTALVALASFAWLVGALASGPLDARGPQPEVALPRIAPASYDGSSQNDELLRGVNSSGTAKDAADAQSWVTPADIAGSRRSSAPTRCATWCSGTGSSPSRAATTRLTSTQ